MSNAAYATSILGANFTSTSTTALFSIGTIARGVNGAEFVYCVASGAITANFVVKIAPATWAAAMLSTSNDARGDIVGVAPCAFADTEYGWIQRAGPILVQVGASCAANVLLNTTATAGMLDDDATTGAFTVPGVYLTAARGGTNGTAAGILNYPQEGVVL